MQTTLPIETKRPKHTELRLTDTGTGLFPFAVGVFPIGEDTGICIGVGASIMGALNDALDTLQMARWALHDAIVVEGKRRPG